MSLIIDANVIKGYYDEEVIEIEHNLTQSAKLLIESEENIFCIDEGDQIKSEWSAVVDPDWLNAWLAVLIRDGKIQLINVQTKLDFGTELTKLGFPNSRDIWYIRTAKSCQTESNPTSTIISEDIDFYDPKKKTQSKGAARIKILKSPTAPIRKLLRKKGNIEVNCVEEFMQ